MYCKDPNRWSGLGLLTVQIGAISQSSKRQGFCMIVLYRKIQCIHTSPKEGFWFGPPLLPAPLMTIPSTKPVLNYWPEKPLPFTQDPRGHKYLYLATGNEL